MYPDSKLHLNFETGDTVTFFNWTYDPLNNWSAHRVRIWGRIFATVEHAYHYRKFRETAPEVADEILEAPSPWAAMAIDRAHSLKRRPDWHDAKAEIMRELLRAKLAQNEDVRECLKATGAKTIVENSPWDNFWGCGADGKGENTMGKLWMELRSEDA